MIQSSIDGRGWTPKFLWLSNHSFLLFLYCMASVYSDHLDGQSELQCWPWSCSRCLFEDTAHASIGYEELFPSWCMNVVFKTVHHVLLQETWNIFAALVWSGNSLLHQHAWQDSFEQLWLCFKVLNTRWSISDKTFYQWWSGTLIQSYPKKWHGSNTFMGDSISMHDKGMFISPSSASQSCT